MGAESPLSPDDAGQLLRQAGYYLAEELPEKAIPLYRRAAASPSCRIAALMGAADALAAGGRFEDARAHLLEALRHDARCAALYGRLARLSLAERHCAEAERWAKKAEGLEPETAEWTRIRAEAMLGEGRNDEALTALSRAVALDAGNVSTRVLLADALANAGRAREALRHAELAARKAPGHGSAILTLADLRARLGDAAGALTEYGKAARLSPSDATARLRRGQLLLDLGRADEGFADLEWVVDHFPANAAARQTLAEGYWRDGRVRDALAAYEAALASGVSSCGLYLGRAEALSASGRPTEAEEDCTRALALDPMEAAAWSARGGLRLRLGRLAEAEADLDRAAALDGSVASTYALRGELHERRGEWTAAAADYAAALRLGEEDPALRSRWLRAIRCSGDDAGALAWLERACRREPSEMLWWLLRGDVLSSLGRGADALKSYARASEAMPDAAEPHLREAEHHERQGNWLEAVAAVNRALEIVPNDPVGYWMRSHLHDRMGCPDLAAADRALAAEYRRERER